MGKVCMVGRGSTGIGEKGSFPCLAGEQNGNLIIRKERDLKKKYPPSKKNSCHFTSVNFILQLLPTFFYSNTIKMCIFSENKHPSSLPKEE